MTTDELLSLAYFAGFRGQSLTQAVSVSLAESSGNPSASHTNTDGSTDRGLWQINNYWHPEVTDTCAYDPVCSARAAYKISQSGSNWSPWSTWDGGQAQTHMGSVLKAQNAGKWQGQVGQWAGKQSPLAPTPGSSGAGGAASQGPAPKVTSQNAGPQGPTFMGSSGKLFDCASLVTHTGIGPVELPTGINGDTIACYLLSTIETVFYAFAGLAGLGFGAYLLWPRASRRALSTAASAIPGAGWSVALGERAAAGTGAAAASGGGLSAGEARANRDARQAELHRARSREARARARTHEHRARQEKLATGSTTRLSTVEEARIRRAQSRVGNPRPDRMSG